MKLQYKKYMIFLLGIAILTLGVSMTVKSDIGAGSYDSINFAIADILNTKVSLAISMTAFLVLIITAYIRKGFIRITTFITSVIMGLFTDVWVKVDTILNKLILFIVGMILVCLGIALYMIPKLPTNPTDDLMVALTEKKLSIKKSKMIIDIICIVLAFILKGPIGIGTIVLTFLVGPMVDMFYKILIKYIDFNELEESLS